MAFLFRYSSIKHHCERQYKSHRLLKFFIAATMVKHSFFKSSRATVTISFLWHFFKFWIAVKGFIFFIFHWKYCSVAASQATALLLLFFTLCPTILYCHRKPLRTTMCPSCHTINHLLQPTHIEDHLPPTATTIIPLLPIKTILWIARLRSNIYPSTHPHLVASPSSAEARYE